MFPHASGRSIAFCLIAGLALGSMFPGGLRADAPPPRTINDITAILDEEKPDPKRIAKAQAEADQEVPAGLSKSELGKFYYQRATARAQLGRTLDAIADAKQAIAAGGDYVEVVSRYEQFLAVQFRTISDYKHSTEILEKMARTFEQVKKGRLFNVYLRLATSYMAFGDTSRAEGYISKNRALLRESRSWPNVEKFRSSFQADVEEGSARLAELQGKYHEAEIAYHVAQALRRDSLNKSSSWPSAPPRTFFEANIDYLTALEGRAKQKQGRLNEAEIDIRRALLSRLKLGGKYTPETAQVMLFFGTLLIEQRRYPEAEKVARAAIDIYRTLNYPEDSLSYAVAKNTLGTTLFAENRYPEAARVYDEVDQATRSWEKWQSNRLRLGYSRIYTAYLTGNFDQGIALARELVAWQTSRNGEKSFETAMAHGMVGAGLTFSGHDAEAMSEYRLALPILSTSSHEGDDDSISGSAADVRFAVVVEGYLTLLRRSSSSLSDSAIEESLRFGEAIRGRIVQKALASSSARAAARNPALANLVRTEQDLEKQISAEIGALNTMLSLPPEERDEQAVKTSQAEIAKLRAARDAAERDIVKKFPAYNNLVSPKPPSVAELRAVLKPEEAYLSFYFGAKHSFVWVVPKQGAVLFAEVKIGRTRLDEKVRTLRQALEPHAGTVGSIPPFDVGAAYDLYKLLLEPVEDAWKPAKSLIVATNGALGMLPLGLLPIAPAEVKPDGAMFSGYRDVPWLIRSHAITVVPSAAALRTLRQIPKGPTTRDRLIGFGDPYFNPEQAAEAAQDQAKPILMADATDTTTRGIPLKLRAAPKVENDDSATLADLPRLPDTAEELKSIALALQVDPAKSLFLGKAANEQNVKTQDLAHYRIIDFATHGLVPGDLDGLTQPALALTAPEVAGVEGDGLLTMDKILGLQLNADWVVLSACNTGAGAAGTGSEAATGLGSAFFYAGTRAVVVTNWSVHSASARQLMTDLFRRQAADPNLSRTEAMQQAMNALLDGPGLADAAGNTLYTYGHPLFWAPYTIIGDGGGT